MGLVKISDELHEEIRKSSNVMSRSINSQVEFWVKTGMLAELNPTLTFNEILQQRLRDENVSLAGILHQGKS
ncbi:ParD-like family protein [Shewanella sp.]|uniref:ParD-like family protein n=1 Tax=Shewanella sp. TaxID=50422 RepID=UPI001EBA76A6|nr:ParD-like family protein [Shewanella sp.]NRB25321.1 ParD-like family protein [Shewanella sp.]